MWKEIEVMRISRQSFPLQAVIDQKQLEKWNIFNSLGSRITNDARCTREIKSRIAVAKSAFSKKTHFTSKLDLKLRKELVKCYIWGIVFYSAET